ncbi:aspartate aminotransferase [Endozoicomonas sp. OPT23]|uniref:MalY/PatB family protein n=1 Tax=Endozoicomonas sp. OPT23 TaxID=2072845 RepID=UPI001D22390E|nr:aspartate aminotransferase [Endozoicomonas sp. OPT23]
MPANFDQLIDRSGTSSLKWEKYKDKDTLPFWVADMDFKSAPEIIEALHQRIEHGIFGYTVADEGLEDLVVERMNNLYDWQIEKEWIVWLPGLVTALNLAVRSVAGEGEYVAAPVPVYYPFLTAPSLGGRRMVGLDWVLENGQWRLDLESFKTRLTDDTRLLSICNPQNPNGRVLTRSELEAIEAVCKEHNIVVCSDEVHCDLILDRNCEHIPYAGLSEFTRDNSITLMSPSKTFNVAGFGFAYAIIPNDKLRSNFQRVRKGIVPDPDNMLIGYTAAKAAYQHGEPWRQCLLDYLRGNHDYLLKEINSIEGLSMEPLEATYLAWINVSELGLKDPHGFFEEHGVGLSPGAQFGDKDYLRLNFGCSRELLEQGISRIKAAVESLPH